MATSKVDICNLALQRLGAKTITSLTEDNVRARECNRVYDHARDSELRAHPWSFARKRSSLAADATAPAFGYDNQYTVPTDFLRLLPTKEQKDFQIEANKILTNDDAPLQIVYIAEITDPNLFDLLYKDLLISRIAMDIAEKVTQSNSKIEAAMERYDASKKEAKRINAQERPPEESADDEWITARL